MKCGILFAGVATLLAGMSVSCRRAADPKHIATVDSLITALGSAQLTLNELDTQRYATADSMLQVHRMRFLDRFNDTLDKPSAALLGDQFVQLREAKRRAADHRTVIMAVTGGMERLKRLKQDLVSSALAEEAITHALVHETNAAKATENSVLQVIANYQTNQRALDQQMKVDSLLVDTLPKRHI